MRPTFLTGLRTTVSPEPQGWLAQLFQVAAGHMSVKYLSDQWKFWLILFSRGNSQQQYVIEEVVTVTTLDNFFQFCQSLPHPDELKSVNQKRPSLGLFRQDIKPAREDRRNAHGGSFSFRLPRSTEFGRRSSST
jgi:hypothetical protein